MAVKTNDFDNPNYLEEKRKVYGQYRPVSSKRAKIDDPEYHKTPRKKAVVMDANPMTENPIGSIKLVPCPSCGRKFNQGKLANIRFLRALLYLYLY